MRVTAAEDIECGDLIRVLRKPSGQWYARRADTSEQPNAIAKTFIGQDDMCHWDRADGSLTGENEHD